ncbi:MAG: hypothetical protein U0441_13260 [Polyangiaceae bacterium]
MNLRRFAIAVSATLACAAIAAPSTIARADEPADPPAHLASSTAGPPLAAVRWLHQQIVLDDGRVLVLGGQPGAASTTAEIFDPKANAWTMTAPMLTPHDRPIAARLCDGRVLIAGTGGAGGKAAEIYDPATDTWTPTGSLKKGHVYGVATLLADCRVLFSGGYDSNTQAEVWRPDTGKFTMLNGVMHAERFFHTATLLQDGRVLIVGGGVDISGSWHTYPVVDLYNPADGSFTKMASLHNARRAHTATLLPDGRVLVAGGTIDGKADGNAGGFQVASAEIFDVNTGAWEFTPTPLVTPRTNHTAALMPSGAVVLFGGLDGTASTISSVEGYFGGAWQSLPPLLVDRYLHASTLLADGTVLLTGGFHQATTELYALTDLGGGCQSDLECAGGHCADGLCCNEACDTGCRRCDVPGKLGICSHPCADAAHALACPDGSATCPNDACIQDACGEYRCAESQGACLEKCKSVTDCAPGYACGLDHRCVAPPDVSAVDPESCAVASPGSLTAQINSPYSNSGGAVPTLSGLALAAFLARRRRHPRDAGSSGKGTNDVS